MKYSSLLFLFVAISWFASGQTVLDNNPPLKWNQVRTSHFNILFPKGFDTQAQRLANTLEHIYLPESRTLGSKPRRISVILQNRSSISNAFVSITPRRSEFYTMPSQQYNFIGNNDWLNLIASHEYRHIVQFQHANQGMNRVLYYMLGNTTLSLLANISVPNWFWEGDAVATETAYTPAGRGRIPYFGLVFRTNLMEGRTFNYQKQYLRSYKNNIPDHYVLGYHLVSYARKKTGDPMIWGKITSRAWSLSLVPFTFSNAIKKETGMHVTQLYKEMAKDFQTEWKKATDTLILTASEKINPRRKAYTDYLYPQLLDDGSVVAMKSGIGDIERLVRLRNGIEEKLCVPGVVNETGMLSSGGSRVVWNGYDFDPRWRVRTYSSIKIYDADIDKQWTVGDKKSRYSGAALSPDGTRVATVQSDMNYRHSLVIVDVMGGSVWKEFPNPENYFYSMPRWSADGKSIVVLKTTPHGKSVDLLDVMNGTSTELLPVSQENIGYPVLYDKYLFYNSPVTGIDNIYAYDIENKKTFQVTSSRYGSYNPVVTPDGKLVYYNEQGRNGMNVVRIPFDLITWKPFEKENFKPDKQLFEYTVEQEGRKHLLDSIPDQNYPVTKYSKVKGMFNPYTWGAYFDDTFSQLDLGIASRDLLSTTSINLGYRYDVFEGTGLWRAGLSYQGFYPIIDASVTYGNRQVSTGAFGADAEFNWKETGISAGFRIPLILTKSKYLTSLTVSNNIGFVLTSGFQSKVTGANVTPNIYYGNDRDIRIQGDSLYYLFNEYTDYGKLIFNNFNVSYSHSLKQSRRDFNPAWGQFISLEHYATPYGGDYTGWLWAVRGIFYFPGLYKHHSLYFRAGYQESFNSVDLNIYSFRNRLFKPRGFSYPRNSRFYMASANYELPVWYPDINIGPLLNIQRIKTNLFYDCGVGEGVYHVRDTKNNRDLLIDAGDTYASYGTEITVDFNLFRLLPKFEVGMRVTKPITAGGVVYEFLIGNIGF